MALVELYEYLRWRERHRRRDDDDQRADDVFGVRILTHRPRKRTLTPVPTPERAPRHHRRRHHPMAQIILDPAGTLSEQLPVSVVAISGSGAEIPDALAGASWTVTDQSVATVVTDPATGRQCVVPIAVGSADFTVTATTADGTRFTDGLHVDVVAPPAPPAPTVAGVKILLGDPEPLTLSAA